MVMMMMTLIYDAPPYNPGDLYDADLSQSVLLEARTADELDTHLDDIHKRARHWPLAVCVGISPDDDHEGTPGLSIALGRDLSILEWERDLPGPHGDWDETEQLSSWNSTTDSHPAFHTNHGPEPAWKTIPCALARQAARQFYTTGGQRPTSITWRAHHAAVPPH